MSDPAAPPPDGQTHALEQQLALAFAPLHKRAFGMAIGIAVGLTIFTVTAVHLLVRPAQGLNLALLAEYFSGYTVTWPGAFVGLAWGFVVGFVGGWFFAFCRNLVLALSVFLIRTRAELKATREFLDHI